MTTSYTSLFHRSYGGLTSKQQSQIDAAITRFVKRPDPPYPKGWRVHKLEGVAGTGEEHDEERPDIWEMHAPGPGALIVTFEYHSDGSIMFRNCGLHDKVLRTP